jgi:NTP pyrophosphatase (non-canonical NTP hydrolase)
MDFKTYQQQAKETAIFPEETSLAYLALGVAGEAGEVAEEVKKSLRKGMTASGVGMPENRKENLYEELGDVLWYVANLADQLGFDLNDIAEHNIAKLKERHGR